jgi:TolB-like protein/Tfp pilus assembly protein PilF
MIGRTLSHYILVEPLGAGGVGEVYRARDTHLDRDVAVKVLQKGMLDDRGARERFRREAHVLSRLSHPGVATVFDFDTQDGVDFLVMEYVPGGTLEKRLAGGALAIDEALRVGIAIADALEDAHRGGFLHRDLKPGNVALTTGGTPKLLDFGLAGLLHAQPSQPALTQAGSVFGSLPYMAPEQLRSEPGDARTDVWALGVVLYEMVAGRRPFDQERPEAVLHEILHGTEPPLRTLRADAPPALEHLVTSCLRREPSARPATVGTGARALREIRDAAASRGAAKPREGRGTIRSLAVLPLDNVSRDPAQEYFADGMTEAFIADLTRLGALRVISRRSAMKYKGVQKPLPDIARELDVDAILEGSALLVGKRVRISVQLVAARTDETLWAERYDGELEDVLDLQSRVAETVAKEIALQLTPQEEVRLAAPAKAVNPTAHLEYLRGRHAKQATSPQAIELALKHLNRALEVDPTFAPAWGAIAECHTTRASRGMAPPAEALAEAEAAANRALALDPEQAEGLGGLGMIRALSGDLVGAIPFYEKALAADPGLTDVLMALGRAYYCMERHAEAQESMLRALAIDPLSMVIHTAVGDAYFYARRYEDSVGYYRKAIVLDPRFDGAHTDLARSLEMLGQFDEAQAQYEEGRRLSGGVVGPSFGLGHLAASRGDTAGARRILDELIAARASKVVSAWGIAALHASLGDVDEAFRWLDTAVEERATGLIFLRVHPRLDPIRPDPRYPALVHRLGLDRG